MTTKCSNCTNLRSEIKRLERQIAAKSIALDDARAATPEGIRTLMGQYKPLRRALELLRHGANMADPQSSPIPDKGKGGPVSKKSHVDRPLEYDRFRDAMKRKGWMSKDLERLVIDWQNMLGDIEPQRAADKPRCRKSGCDLKDQRQDYGNFKCKACGEPMSEAA